MDNNATHIGIFLAAAKRSGPPDEPHTLIRSAYGRHEPLVGNHIQYG